MLGEGQRLSVSSFKISQSCEGRDPSSELTEIPSTLFIFSFTSNADVLPICKMVSLSEWNVATLSTVPSKSMVLSMLSIVIVGVKGLRHCHLQ